jgi:hypothetical protein
MTATLSKLRKTACALLRRRLSLKQRLSASLVALQLIVAPVGLRAQEAAGSLQNEILAAKAETGLVNLGDEETAYEKADGVYPLEEKADMCFALVIDVSGSIDADRFALQKLGYVEALRDPEIIKALIKGNGTVLMIIEFDGFQYDAIKATHITTERQAIDVSNRYQRRRRPNSGAGATALGSAMYLGINRVAKCMIVHQALNAVIDVSGDGPDDVGNVYKPLQQKLRAIDLGVVINGLAIKNSEEKRVDIVKYYEENVSNRLLFVADGFEVFGRAAKEKMLAETVDNQTDQKRERFAGGLFEGPLSHTYNATQSIWALH